MANESLSKHERKQLQQLLQKCHVNLSELHGLLCAAATVPHALFLNQRLPELIHKPHAFSSSDEMSLLFDLIFRLYNEIMQHFEEVLFFPLVDCHLFSFFSVHDLNEIQQANLRFWCTGYIQGISLNVAGWQQTENKLFYLLYPIYILSHSSPEEAEEVWKDYQNELIAFIPKLLPTIYHFFRISESEPIHLQNELCSCLSGKNFKECCRRLH